MREKFVLESCTSTDRVRNMKKVVITGWRYSLKKITLTQAIQVYTGLGLAAAKKCTDDLLAGKTVAFENLSDKSAKAFLEEIQGVGGIVELHDENEGAAS